LAPLEAIAVYTVPCTALATGIGAAVFLPPLSGSRS
jgi:hypothetical protein